MSDKTQTEETLAEDILTGAKAIGEFIDANERRVYHLAENGLLPIGRIGRRLTASKKRLREAYVRLTAGLSE